MLPKVFAPVILFSICLITAGCGESSATTQTTPSSSIASEYAININTATLDELQRIPYVGEKVAERIVEHREINGPFRRVEHLMLIQGISDKRFRKIRPLVRVE
ncbi:MAG: helix-hairpin-helix domain-containing protein [bacterium]|nr:helix-hairpin-helix domain-containing protein [bacterium]